ncbi:MAG: tetratricopeptide repeat protein [Bdellovibrionota bacterium]
MNWLDAVTEARKRGSFEDAMQILTAELSQRPNDGVVHYQIAWTHDALGKEFDAAPAYETAIALGLTGEDLEGAYLGLGSTYRCLGDYKNSERVLKKAISLFPENGALKVFFALAQYNLQNYSAAVELLLKELVRTSDDKNIKTYSRALLFYSDKLKQKFE